MANTFTSLHYHLVFSTKNRTPWIAPEIETRIWQYLGGIARENQMKALCIGGVDDHVHILLGVPATMAISKAVQLIKGGSSKWIHETFEDLSQFAWQDGYGAFTVSNSNLEAAGRYIRKQREHHRKMSFAEELAVFLVRHEIAFDERYLLG